MSVGKILVAFVLSTMVLGAGCLEKPQTYTYEFPHAREVVVVKEFKVAQGVRLGGSAMLPQPTRPTPAWLMI